jgi:hypothetical protein
MQAWLLKPWAKPLVFTLCLLPCAWLFYAAFTDGLGANPAEALLRSTGDWTLRFLCIVLAVTPLRQISGWNLLVRYRRMLGLYVFFYACLHLLCYAWFDMGLDWGDIVADIPKRPFILVGFSTWLLLLVLAVTSPKFMLRAWAASAGNGCTAQSMWRCRWPCCIFSGCAPARTILPRWRSMRPFSEPCWAGECCVHSEAINRPQRAAADVSDARPGRSLLKEAGRRLVEQVDAALQAFEPVEQVANRLLAHDGRAMLGHDHVYGQLARHLHPQPQNLVGDHVAAVKAFHACNMRARSVTGFWASAPVVRETPRSPVNRILLIGS